VTAWRFPIIDRNYEPDEDKPRRNLVTFVFYDGQLDHTVELLSTATGLDREIPLDADTSLLQVDILPRLKAWDSYGAHSG